MPTIPAIGKKKVITKKEANKFYTLNDAFDFIGKKVNGESWEQLKNCHTSCYFVDVLSELIEYDFFDLFNQDDAINKLSDRQKSALLNNDVNYQSFAHKINTRDKNVVITGQSISSPSTKLTNSIKRSFYKKYNPNPNTKYRSAKTKKTDDEIIIPAFIGNEPDKIIYNFPTNFLIPKDQFSYVLETGRRWQDKKPQTNGIILSKFHTNFRFISNAEMIMAGSKENIMNYDNLANHLKINLDATEAEIAIWLYDRELTILRDVVEDDGYIAVEYFANKPRQYKPTFYYKKEVENFSPKFRFLEYQQVKEKWQKEFGQDESSTLEFLSYYFDNYDLIKLFENKSWDNKTCSPRHRDYNKTFETSGSSSLSQLEKIEFIKECLFEKTYVKKIEERHFNSLSSQQQSKQFGVVISQDIKDVAAVVETKQIGIKKTTVSYEKEDNKLNIDFLMTDGTSRKMNSSIKSEYSQIMDDVFCLEPETKIILTETQYDYFAKKIKDNLKSQIKKKARLDFNLQGKIFKLSLKTARQKSIQIISKTYPKNS
jgi:hypothetical protein